MDLAALFEQPEGTLFDRKSRLLVVEGATDPKHADNLKDFVRHTVALANWARMSGHHACMVFGVGDVSHPGGVVPTDGVGILNQSAATSAAISWPTRDDRTAFQACWSAYVVKPYEKAIRQYIGPRLGRATRNAERESALRYRLCHQWHDDALLAALEILPTYTEEPLYVATPGVLGLPVRHYVRVNDNSVPIEDAEATQILTRATDQPYLPPEDWRLYLAALHQRLDLDTRPVDPRRPDAYYELSVKSYADGHTYDMGEVWKRIAAPEVGSSRVIMFVGEPGTGKTEVLKRHLRALADEALKELDEGDELLEPTRWIPVYVPISSYDLAREVDEVVFDAVARHLAEAGRLFPPFNRGILAARRLKFLVAIDGVDEMSQLSVEEKAMRIEGFLDRHIRSNHAVSSRASRAPRHWLTKYGAYELLPFSPEQIRGYLGQSYSVSELDSTRMRALLQELQPALGIPRLLKAFLAGLEQGRVSSFGQAWQAIYHEIWKTEERRSRGGSGDLAPHRKRLLDYAILCATNGVESCCEVDEPLSSAAMQETVRWAVNAGLLKRCGAWPEEIKFAQDEFMDLILTEHLIRIESKRRKTPVETEQYEAILSGLDQVPEHRQRIARIILNLVDEDLSSAPWWHWLSRLSHPVLRLRVTAERRRSSLLSLGVLEEALAELSNRESHPLEEAVNWLAELLGDRDVAIQECVLGRIPDTYLRVLVPVVLQALRESDSASFVYLACCRLIEAGIPADNEVIRSQLTEWLRSTDWGRVETALSLIGEWACHWAGDEVYVKGVSVDLPDYLRSVAKRALELLQDPRSQQLEELLPQSIEEVTRLNTAIQFTEEAIDALSVIEQLIPTSDTGDPSEQTEGI